MQAEEESSSNTPSSSSSSSSASSSSANKYVHEGDLICNSLSCAPCRYREMKITIKFFQGSYRDMLIAQRGENICDGSNCKVCTRSLHPEKIKCPTCGKHTGEAITGLLGMEVFQVHTIPEHIHLFGPLKQCGCVIHFKSHLICNKECHVKSIFRESVSQNQWKYKDEKRGPEIPEAGPVVATHHYLAKDKNKGEQQLKQKKEVESKVAPPKDTCIECKKVANLRCSRCKTTSYCSRDCQKQHWKQHKQFCKPVS